MKIRYWLDSGANIHSCKNGSVSLEELGITLEEWKEMDENDREELMRPVALESLDWGFEVIED